MTETATDFVSLIVNGAVTVVMVGLIAALFVCAIGPFFGRGRR